MEDRKADQNANSYANNAKAFAAGFLADVILRLEGHKEMADRAIRQLTGEQLFTAVAAASNSVAVIMQHMAGNMESRWTNFLSEDGEKPWRNRDLEFEQRTMDVSQLMEHWEKGWACFLGALKGLNPEDLDKHITIRGESLKAYDALIRQLLHYGGHIGQIVYVAKWLKGNDWQPLTIPKSQSQGFNQSMGYKP